MKYITRRVAVFGALLMLTILVAACTLGQQQPAVNQPADTDDTAMEDTDDSAVEDDTAAPDAITVQLSAQNNSNQSGTATISDENGKAKVTITVAGSGTATPQPAHIHTGACPTPGGVVYPLTNVVNGQSVTMLDVSTAELLNQLPLAINIHKSAAEVSTYVSCGNIATDDATMVDDAGVKVIDISGRNFAFSITEIRVKKGDTVRIVLTSASGFHDWVVDEFDARTSQINTGQTAEVEFTADQVGTFEYYCSVGQHRQMGMVGKLIVE